MPVPASLVYHFDRPLSWRPESPAFEIEGWLYAGSGEECLDIRARVDDRLHLGVYGLDRPDLAGSLGDNPAARRSGFIQRIQVWSGARELAMDYLDGSGNWREFFRVTLDTAGLPPTPKPRPRFPAGIVYDTLNRLYRHFHRAPFLRICAEADRMLAEVLAEKTDFPEGEAFSGHIENPSQWVNVRYDKVRVTGWAFAVGRDIKRLNATTAVVTENRLIHPKDRPDVATHRPDHANALKSGYYGLVDIRPELPSPVNLKIFADLGDGVRRLAFARRLHLDRRDEHSGPVPYFSSLRFAQCVIALFRGLVLRRFTIDDRTGAWSEIRRLRNDLGNRLGSGKPDPVPAVPADRRDMPPYSRWVHHNRLTPKLVSVLREDARALEADEGPLISVVVPAFNTPETFLRELLDSLLAQIYPRWELCIADDASTKSHMRRILEKSANKDPRIKPVFRSDNGHIARATNSAIDAASGEWIALVDHDDLLPADALLHVARAINTNPHAGLFYTDEDKIDDSGNRFDPQFKGAWSPEMALTHNYTHHLTVIRRDLVEKAGRLRPEFNGAQDIDLFLRCFERLDPDKVIHVPFVCYHWRAHGESTARRGDQKEYLFEAARSAIEESLNRRGLKAVPFLPEFAQVHALCLHQLRWDPSILRENPVTIVIPTRNRADLLRRCLDSLARTTSRDTVRVVVVDDRSNQPDALEFLESLPERDDLECEVVRAESGDDEFNYSRLVNLGSARARTPLLLHLNNDIEALQPGWLEDMAGWLSISGVGVVGAKLLHPDGTINHAGISLSPQDGLPHTLFAGEPDGDLGYLFLPHTARNVIAVTGACMLVRTADYRRLGGFDEDRFKVAYNDVDYCLRCRGEGLRTVYSPQTVLQHEGSASRGRSYTESEHVAFLERHGPVRDPFLSTTLEFPPTATRINPYAHRYAETPRPFRILVISHNLNFEGAPIFIWELARHLAAQQGIAVTVLAGKEGPLRTRYEELGIIPEIRDAAPAFEASTPDEFRRFLETLAAGRSWNDVDLVVANSLSSFFGVHLAAKIGKPSVLYVHESSPVEKAFDPPPAAPMREVAEDALRLATRVVFTAQASRRVFETHNRNDNFRTLTSWVDIPRIERFAEMNKKRDLRRKHGIDPDETLVVNIGSACERKGHHIYIRAIDLLRKNASKTGNPDDRVRYAIVGGREGFYMETLLEDIELLGLRDLLIFPETPDIFDFYRMADILVCTSFEESFPRVLLEAMAFRVRIVSTDVDGIPEMLTNNDEAYLVPAGDPFKLSAVLQKALSDHCAGNHKMISMAYARAIRQFHPERTLPLHLQLCREAFLSG